MYEFSLEVDGGQFAASGAIWKGDVTAGMAAPLGSMSLPVKLAPSTHAEAHHARVMLKGKSCGSNAHEWIAASLANELQFLIGLQLIPRSAVLFRK